MRHHFCVPVLLLFSSCASVTPYAPTSDATARVRLVAQGPGNAYFAVAKEMKCGRKFGNALGDGDQMIEAVGGQPNNWPKFGSPRVLGIPGAKIHPDWTYVEVKMDANRDTVLHTSFVLASGANPYDVGICDSVTSVRLETGRDYEVIFAAGRQSCMVSVAEVRQAGGQVLREPVQPTSGPQACSR